MIMHIPAYQIHNVLNTYSLQLFKAGGAQHKDAGQGAISARISPETSRMAVIDKVAAEIVQRITRIDAIAARSSRHPSPFPASEKETPRTEMQTIFTFNTLDIQNIKTCESLSVEDSIFLIKKDPPD